jgi:hypothetical protein
MKRTERRESRGRGTERLEGREATGIRRMRRTERRDRSERGTEMLEGPEGREATMRPEGSEG